MPIQHSSLIFKKTKYISAQCCVLFLSPKILLKVDDIQSYCFCVVIFLLSSRANHIPLLRHHLSTIPICASATMKQNCSRSRLFMCPNHLEALHSNISCCSQFSADPICPIYSSIFFQVGQFQMTFYGHFPSNQVWTRILTRVPKGGTAQLA